MTSTTSTNGRTKPIKSAGLTKKGEDLLNYHFNLIHCGVLITFGRRGRMEKFSDNDGRNFHPSPRIYANYDE